MRSAPRVRVGRVAALVVLFSALSSSACWTSASEGEQLRDRVRELEREQSARSEVLRGEIEVAHTKVAALEDVLDRATQVVTRSSADTGAQVEQLQQQVMALEGQLAELRNEVQRRDAATAERQAEVDRRLSKIARHAGVDGALDESEIPGDADAHFAAADEAFQRRQFSRSRALYRAFVERHGSDSRADDALYRVGASYLQENRPATALGEFRRVIGEHPQGDMADDALAAMAEAFYALHACTDARAALQALIRAHPRSPLVRRARTRLRELERAPASYCTR